MELSSEEGVMPIPINSSYGGGHGHGHGLGHGHMIHHDPAPHNHIIPSSAPPPPPPQLLSNIAAPPMPTTLEDHMPYNNNNNNNNNNNKKLQVVRYRECLKNHAAAMGGSATDGCGEFMPSGQEGTLEALICSACNCHRNFHRKETEGGHELPNSSSYDCYHSPHPNRINVGRKVILGHHKNMLGGPEALGYPTGLLIPSRGAVPHHHHSIVSYNIGGSLPSESDEQDDGGVVTRPYQLVKKRFRTKFSQEQKDKMLNFAEKVGWKIQKQEEAVVQQFCQEIGVKRRVLKVWMHNNKHNLAKKISPTNDQDQI